MGDVAAHVDQRYRSDCSDWRPLAWMIAGYDLDVEGTPLSVASPSATTALMPHLKRAECLRDPEMEHLGAFSFSRELAGARSWQSRQDRVASQCVLVGCGAAAPRRRADLRPLITSGTI
jgi:hypothetical protein